jgi:tRNA threonylcarbamoyladenosine biosynthesis protein TsaE
MAKSARSRRLPGEFLSQSAEETHGFGRRLARQLRPGDCLLLVGDLGAGKTTLVQGIAEGLGIEPREILSPTFVLIREHEGRIALYHVDAYRIENPEEWIEVGLAEYFQRAGIVVIEWGQKVKAYAPPDAVEIQLEILEGDRRRIRVLSPERSRLAIPDV